jgi:undecaprenyl diphosphate synthase
MHIAFIMDGNGRWAINKGQTRAEGHDAGIETANLIMKACVKRQIKNATFYAFSVQNWSRDRTEIENIYESGKKLFEQMRPWTKDHNVQVRCIGNKFNLLDNLESEENPKVREALALAKDLMNETKGNTGTIITLCVSYGGREEILDVFQQLQEQGTNLKTLTTTMVSDFFQVPDVDLVVRTSGEYRISNFLLWQSAYAEYHFTKTFWPDFTEQELDSILADFYKRDRRFGSIGPKPSLIPFDHLQELYEELFQDPSSPIPFHTLYQTLNNTHAFHFTPYEEQESRTKFLETIPVSKGATQILEALSEVVNQDHIALVAKNFTLEQLDYVCQKPMRLPYLDTTSEEKGLIRNICQAFTKERVFSSRTCGTYYFLRLYAKHIVHEDALVPCAIVLTICSDILDKRYDLPYFDDMRLYSILTNAIQDMREGDSTSPTKDLLTWTALAITYYYFEDHMIPVPKSSKDLLAFLAHTLKENAATTFLSTYTHSTEASTSLS